MKQLLQQIAIPRAVGTTGNNQIINIIKEHLEKNAYSIDSQSFTCKVWESGTSWLEYGHEKQSLLVSPYSKGFIGKGIAKSVHTIEALNKLNCDGKILFLSGELTVEPLQPKDYPFYYPETHKKIIDLLEAKKPLAVITVTGRHPMCGLEPYPLFEDGNFKIPSGYMSKRDFDKIKEEIEESYVSVHIDSHCTKVKSEQIFAKKATEKAKGKIIICAHMDSKNNTMGALDNATGVSVLLKLAKQVTSRNYDIEIVPFNTEEYYEAQGEVLYLKRMKQNEEQIALLINIDSVGHIGSKVAVALYNIFETMSDKLTHMISDRENIVIGEQWYAGDHAAFAFSGVPCISIISSDMGEGGLDCTHTMNDTIETVDEKLLWETVTFIKEVVNKMDDL